MFMGDSQTVVLTDAEPIGRHKLNCDRSQHLRMHQLDPLTQLYFPDCD